MDRASLECELFGFELDLWMPGSRQKPDGRPPMVVAMFWVHQITTISLMMVAPAGLGYWLDKKWNTDPWLVIVGAALGFITAMSQLLQLANPNQNKKKDSDSKAKHS